LSRAGVYLGHASADLTIARFVKPSCPKSEHGLSISGLGPLSHVFLPQFGIFYSLSLLTSYSNLPSLVQIMQCGIAEESP